MVGCSQVKLQELGEQCNPLLELPGLISAPPLGPRGSCGPNYKTLYIYTSYLYGGVKHGTRLTGLLRLNEMTGARPSAWPHLCPAPSPPL